MNELPRFYNFRPVDCNIKSGNKIMYVMGEVPPKNQGMITESPILQLLAK